MRDHFDGDFSDGLDYRERDGFLTGKSAAIADWRFKKEQADFEKLCEALYMRKWRAARPEKVAAANAARRGPAYCAKIRASRLARLEAIRADAAKNAKRLAQKLAAERRRMERVKADPIRLEALRRYKREWARRKAAERRAA